MQLTLCRGIKSEVELWKAGHQVILAHAHASKLYRTKYQPAQGGTIGITLSGDWTEPFDDSQESKTLWRSDDKHEQGS